MNDLPNDLSSLEAKLVATRTTLKDTPEMLDAGPYLASYDTFSYESQGTRNPEWRVAFDEWSETRNAIIDMLVKLLNAGEFTILEYWETHSDEEHRELAGRARVITSGQISD